MLQHALCSIRPLTMPDLKGSFVSSDYSSEAVLAAEKIENQRAKEMVEAREAEVARALRVFAWLSLAVIVADQISKAWIRSWLPLHSEHEIISGWLSFSHVLNKGAAWGMLSGQRWFLIIITLFVMVMVWQMAREFAPHNAAARLGLGLILGGAIGNLIDRIWIGAVTDFIDLGSPIEWIRTFPVFNIADSALTVGVIILLFDFVLHRREVSSPISGKSANSEIS